MHEKLRKVRSRPHHRIATLACRFVLVLWFCAAASASTLVLAQAPLLSPIAGESLRHTPLTLSVQQQSLSELMRQVFRSLDGGRGGQHGGQEVTPIQSIWLDRHVDRELEVSLVAAATPAAQVFLKIASEADLAVFPVPGVLIVGRPQWVDMTVTLLTAGGGDDDCIWVRWPAGSTAAEVLALILSAPAVKANRRLPTKLAGAPADAAPGGAEERSPTWLPHDVWQGGELIGVDRTLAVSLVLAQFELSLKPGTQLHSLLVRASPGQAKAKPQQLSNLPAGVQPWSELAAATAFPLSYPAADSATAIRELLAKSKPRATIRASGERLLILATAKTHRSVIATHWSSVAKKTARAADVVTGDAVFDLKLINKPAAVVLNQLAAAAGKQLRIEAAATDASERLVSLDASKKTLRELAEMVAQSAGLAILWGDQEVVLELE